MDSFQKHSPASLTATVRLTAHSVDSIKIIRLQVKGDRMGELFVEMKNVGNIATTGQDLSESFRTHVGMLSGENELILQALSDAPNVNTEQCNESMAVVTEDIWKLGCWGCRDLGRLLFKCPYLTTVQRTGFLYNCFIYHAEANAIVAKRYMEKAQHRTGTSVDVKVH